MDDSKVLPISLMSRQLNESVRISGMAGKIGQMKISN